MASDLRGEGSRLRKRASTVTELWEGWPKPQGCADGLGGRAAGCRGTPRQADKAKPTPGGGCLPSRIVGMKLLSQPAGWIPPPAPPQRAESRRVFLARAAGCLELTGLIRPPDLDVAASCITELRRTCQIFVIFEAVSF